MTGQEMQFCREEMEITRRELAVLLGYDHADSSQDYNTIKRMETGKRNISPMCARLVTMIYRSWKATGNIPEFE